MRGSRRPANCSRWSSSELSGYTTASYATTNRRDGPVFAFRLRRNGRDIFTTDDTSRLPVTSAIRDLRRFLRARFFKQNITKRIPYGKPPNYRVFAAVLRPLYRTGRVSDRQRGDIREKRPNDRRRGPGGIVQHGRSLDARPGGGRRGGDRVRQGAHRRPVGPMIAAICSRSSQIRPQSLKYSIVNLQYQEEVHV